MAKIPTIHMNGSSAERLLEGYQEILEKAAELMSAMGEAPLNARDYYPQGPAAWGEADDEFRSYVVAVRTLIKHFNEVVNGIHDQIEDRKRQR